MSNAQASHSVHIDLDEIPDVSTAPEGNKSYSVKSKKRQNKRRSPIWDHFDLLESNEGTKVKCKYCKLQYNYNPKVSGTSSCWAHINRCTKYPYNTPKNSGQTKLSFKKASTDGSSGLTYQKYDPEAIRKALAYMILVDELPFKFVESEGFRYFCSVMEPRFHVPSRVTVAKDCYQNFLTEKKSLKRLLKNNSSRFSFTTDTWTSIQQINYMCLTVHFIDNEWNLQKRILNFCPISSHRGEEIGKLVEKCLNDWEIEKVFCITVDNASSNDTAVAYMKKKVNSWKTGILGSRFLHMRCVAHIINLVVGDGMKCVGESVLRIRHVVRYIKQSPARLQKFKKCVEDEKIGSKKLLSLDVPTRWNSTYLMLDAALQLEQAFDRFDGDDPHYSIELYEREGKGKPTDDDFANVKRLTSFLENFYEFTLRVSGCLYVTANQFFHELVNVSALIKSFARSDDPDMCLMATHMRQKYDKYWGDPEKINILILIAVVLDPRYKLDYVEWMLSEVYDSHVARSLALTLKTSMYAMFEEYRVLDLPSKSGMREEVSCSGKEDLSSQKKMIEVLKTKYKKQKHEKEGESKLEIDRYLEEDTEEDSEEFDILGWWRTNSARYVVVSKMARDVLSVPISTVASESAFSTGGRVLDPFRSSLSPKVVESLVCAQDWLRASPVPINVEECLEDVEKLEQDLSKVNLGDKDGSQGTEAES